MKMEEAGEKASPPLPTLGTVDPRRLSQNGFF